MLNVRAATAGEINEIIDKLKTSKLYDIDYSYDSEDELGFVSASLNYGLNDAKTARLGFQDRGYPCFFEFIIGRDRFDVYYPKGELEQLLIKLTKKAKERSGFGLTLKEKLSGVSTPEKLSDDDIQINENKNVFKKFLSIIKFKK